MLLSTLAVIFTSAAIKNCLGKTDKGNNVCKRWEDYDTLATNPNCWHNPNAFSNTQDIVTRLGYTIKEYTVETEDGYILSLFRVGKKESDPTDKQPVLMMHGMSSESTFWVCIPSRSLAIRLIEEDYDVWLGNFRGNKYGRKHKNLDPTNGTAFWDYSIDELGKYDVPAIIEVVRKETNYENKIIYIGHSMGTTAIFMYASEQKKEAEENLLAIIAVSPSAYLKDMTYLRYIIPIVYPVSVRLEKTYSALNLNNFMINPLLTNTMKDFCLGSTARIRTCFYVTQLMFGFDEEEFLPEDFPIVLSYGNSGISFKCVTQYVQMAGSQKFQHYDYGSAMNKQLYNKSKPLVYRLSDITVPVHMFTGKNDALTTYKNVMRMYNDLTCEKSITVISEDGSYRFNHIDFIVAKDVEELFNKPLVHLLNEKLMNNRIK